jgi:hypothetical protein
LVRTVAHDRIVHRWPHPEADGRAGDLMPRPAWDGGSVRLLSRGTLSA